MVADTADMRPSSKKRRGQSRAELTAVIPGPRIGGNIGNVPLPLL